MSISKLYCRTGTSTSTAAPGETPTHLLIHFSRRCSRRLSYWLIFSNPRHCINKLHRFTLPTHPTLPYDMTKANHTDPSARLYTLITFATFSTASHSSALSASLTVLTFSQATAAAPTSPFNQSCSLLNTGAPLNSGSATPRCDSRSQWSV